MKQKKCGGYHTILECFCALTRNATMCDGRIGEVLQR
jgi:hypothetical protein